MSFAIVWQTSDRLVVGISDEHNPDIGFTTEDVAPDYEVTVLEDDSQYQHCISDASAYLCTDDITVQPLEPC